MKNILLLLSSWFLITHTGFAQSYSNEIQVISENDGYRWKKNDGYYTNGLFINYSYLPKKINENRSERVAKVTSTIGIGQMIFNPETVFHVFANQIDRPYAGYLFVNKGFSFFYTSENSLTVSASVGTIGPNSLGENTQWAFHEAFNYTPPVGWKTQILNEVGVNLQAQYRYAFIRNGEPRKAFQAYGTAQATLGTIFTNASVGAMLQVGLFNQAFQSSLFQSSIGGERPAPEIYLYFHPQVSYQAYNATIQGGLFRENKGPVVRDITHVVYHHQIGLALSNARLTFRATLDFRQKEVTTMNRNAEKYGSFSLAYRFN